MNSDTVPLPGTVTEITLDTGFEDDDVSQVRKVNLVYRQDQSFKGIRRTFTIFNNVQLNYLLEGFRQKRASTHRFNLCYVNPEPVQIKVTPWKWLFTALGSTMLCVFLIYVGYYTEYASQGLVVTGIVMGTFSLIALMIFIYQKQNKLVFRSLYGEVLLFDMNNLHQGDQEFSQFRQLLEKQILAAQKSRVLRHRLAGELQELRRLKNENYIDSETYELARGKIFKHEAYRVS